MVSHLICYYSISLDLFMIEPHIYTRYGRNDLYWHKYNSVLSGVIGTHQHKVFLDRRGCTCQNCGHCAGRRRRHPPALITPSVLTVVDCQHSGVVLSGAVLAADHRQHGWGDLCWWLVYVAR